MKKKRNRKAQDATPININALKKRIDEIEFKIDTLLQVLEFTFREMRKPKRKGGG